MLAWCRAVLVDNCSHGVALVPGVAFGEPLGIRIAYATDIEKVVEAMERFKNFFNSLS